MLKPPIFTSIHIIFSSIFESAILAKTGEEIQLFYVITFESPRVFESMWPPPQELKTCTSKWKPSSFLLLPLCPQYICQLSSSLRTSARDDFDLPPSSSWLSPWPDLLESCHSQPWPDFGEGWHQTASTPCRWSCQQEFGGCCRQFEAKKHLRPHVFFVQLGRCWWSPI